MRILRLDLLAFGPFTNTTLDFQTSNRALHLIYGPNEAGKSSCLRALRGWLYGFPTQNDDNFLHSYPNMRVGGWVQNNSGERLEFVRRKGKQKTLRSVDEKEVIEDARLRPFLGGVDQTTFTTRFAFGYQELQFGGEQIARGTGDLAEMLFAAGSGVTRLREVQKGLTEEIQHLFKPRGVNAAINSSLQSFKESRKKAADLSLASADWESQCDSLKKAQQRLQEIIDQIKINRALHSRCSRLIKALPLANQLVLASELLTEVADAPILDSDFGARRIKAVDRKSDAEHRLRETDVQVKRLQRLLSEVTPANDILRNRSMIMSLHTELGSYQKAASDRPRLMAELDTLKSEARKHCTRIGWDTDLEKASSFKLPITHRKRIDALATEWAALLSQKEELQKSESKLRAAISELDSQEDPLSGQIDIEGLRQIYRTSLRYSDSEQELEQLRQSAQLIHQGISLSLSRLPSFQGSIEDLVVLPVPFKETVEKFERDWKSCRDKISRRQERIEDLKQRIRKLDRKIEKLRLEHDLPSEEDLQAARSRRELGWQLIRRKWFGATSSPTEDSEVHDFIALWPGSEDITQAFHASVQSADAVVDRLRREAVRVSEKTNWTTERLELWDQLEAEESYLTQAALEEQALSRLWVESWQECEIEPLTPEEMLAWIQARDELLAMNRHYRQTIHDSSLLHSRVTGIMQSIRQSVSVLDYPVKSLGDSLANVLENCDTLIQEIDAANQRSVSRKQQLEKLNQELAETLEKQRLWQERMEHWNLEWNRVATWLALREEIRPTETQEILREIDQLTAQLSEIESLQQRVAGIDRDAKQFSAKAESLLQNIDQTRELSIDQAVVELHQRLQVALTTQSKMEEWQEQLEIQQTSRANAISDLERWSREIASLCMAAGCANVSELPDVERRSQQRQVYEKEISDYRHALMELAGSENLQEFLENVRQSNSDQLAAELHQLGEQILALDSEHAEAAQEIGARQAELKRMDGSSLAAQAQEDAEHHLACIRSGAEHYIRLRLADMLLRSSIERFREANQGPVLKRASEMFRVLTLGSFSGLRADFNEQGHAVLLGVRADGVTSVGISGMSTGTCDQLYMALRLAMIETYTSEYQPMPLIVDDVLIQFDDQRSAAALGLLADLAEKTQVIYFTHHHRIVELAQQNLPTARCVVQRLG